MKKITLMDLILEYFKKHSKQDLQHGPVVDWVEQKYLELYKKKPRDIWRAIRYLHQKGILIKVKKGVYKYDPDLINYQEIDDFTPEQKRTILERDNYKCFICGRSANEGYELHIDHILPRDKGGKSTLDNAQTLCSICNFRKKNYNQTESGRRMFIRLLETSKSLGDETMQKFCEEILEVYEKYNINGHIEWKKQK